ncbi:MAG: L-threonylcarbamoyladenylate synthase [Bacteroidaceae bacterium]|nr:L-threonylcarbamoyladenylate synthase [Bacteroidaceae bacterium]
MKTIKLYAANNRFEDIDQVVSILNDGGLIIFPTDSVYAVGCHALKERAVERICQLKRVDPRKNRLSVICYDLSMISQYAKIDNTVFKLMKRNLPGAFTFIVPTNSSLPKIFRNRKEVGIRMPDAAIIKEIARCLDAPIMTASLPLDEDEPDFSIDPALIIERYGDRVALVIDGEDGVMTESTIVACTSGDIEIVRQGKGELIL